MSKKQKPKADTVKITGKCINCGRKETLTAQQILDAEQSDVAISSCCNFPMSIDKVDVKFAKK